MMDQAGVRSDRPEGERSRYAYAPCQFRSEADRTDTGDRVESISTTADDVQAIVKMQNLAEISAGDCVALHTGQGNSWSNDRYKSMNADQREAARDLFAEGEPGFSLSACEYLASRDIALTIGDVIMAALRVVWSCAANWRIHAR
jgi:kynurenine formamidase